MYGVSERFIDLHCCRQGLRALRVLHCHGVADQAVVRLLELNASTLEEVDIVISAIRAGALPLLAACPSLRVVTVNHLAYCSVWLKPRLKLLHVLPEDNVLRPLERSGAFSR